MKKFFTLCSGVVFSAASFAAFSPNRLTVSTDANAIIKVTVDGDRFNQPSAGSTVVFENLQPGFHTITVYQLNDKRYGRFGRDQNDDYRLLYSGSVNLKPFFSTSIALNRFGRMQMIEQPMHGNHYTGRNDRRFENGRSYGTGPDGRNDAYGYDNLISDADFFAAERVMDRENDNGRLLYAKRLADENYLSAEQVKELARFFSFDNYRLDFVKYAFYKTADKNNFSVVCGAFSSNDGRNQVESFLKTCK
jgi:hypothetical protein